MREGGRGRVVMREGGEGGGGMSEGGRKIQVRQNKAKRRMSI